MKLNSKDYLLVGIQAILFILYYFNFGILKLSFPQFVKNTALIFAVFGGLISVIAILQLNKNLSPFPTPKSGGKLIQTGLFKFVRHPIYSGILIGLGGFAIYTSSGFRVIICLLLYVLFSVKTEYEEKLLIQKFEEYKQYQKKTGKFLPKGF